MWAKLQDKYLSGAQVTSGPDEATSSSSSRGSGKNGSGGGGAAASGPVSNNAGPGTLPTPRDSAAGLAGSAGSCGNSGSRESGPRPNLGMLSRLLRTVQSAKERRRQQQQEKK